MQIDKNMYIDFDTQILNKFPGGTRNLNGKGACGPNNTK